VASAERSPNLSPGAAIYGPVVLAAYDAVVLGFSNRYVWRCPTPRLLAHYDAHVSANHLDVGVGTGYFLDRCRFPVSDPALALLDLHPAALGWARRRLRRYQPRTYRADVLRPFDLGGARFDSVGLNYVLHCLAGDLPSKAIAFDHLAAVLNPGAVLFGATILGRGQPRNRLARRLQSTYNRRGIFSNLADDAPSLDQELGQRFRDHRVEIVGCVALFVARI
jgi:SAM-dependent methyltransferase